MLKRLGVEAVEVRLPKHLDGLDGFNYPGGESTTIGKLAVAYDLMEPLRQFGTKPCHLGNVCGGDLSFKGCEFRPAPARLDGYQSTA